MKNVISTIVLVLVFFCVMNTNAQNAYIANYGDNTVSVINTMTNLVNATIPVGNTPIGVSVNPDGSRVYVANNGDTTVSVINTAIDRVIATVTVGRNPWGIAVTPDGSMVYVANDSSNTVSVIDASNYSVPVTIPVGNLPIGLAISHDGKTVYVLNDNDNTVSVISTISNTVAAVIPVGMGPFAVCVSPNDSLVYIANQYDNTVSVINTASNTVSATIPVGAGPYGLSCTPDGSKLYVTNNGDNADSVSVVNTATNTVTANVIVLPNPYNTNVTPDGSKVYVTNEFGHAVSVIRTSDNHVVATIPVGNNPSSLGNFISPPCAVPPIPVIINGPTAVCDGQGTSTLSTASTYGAYYWSTGATTQSITVVATGIYYVTISNGGICTATAHKSVSFVPSPHPVIVESNASNLCDGGQATLGVSAFPSYIWNTGETTQDIAINAGGSFAVTVTSANGCSGVSTTTITSFCAIPTFPPTTVTNIAATYAMVHWNLPACYYNFTISISVHNANAWTSYTFPPNNHYTFSHLIHNTSYDWEIRTNCDANAIVNSGMSAIHTFTTSARLEEGETETIASAFTIYPNPADAQATIAFTTGTETNYNIRLIDVTGRIIQSDTYSSAIGENQYQLNLSSVAKGMYMVILQSEDGILQSKMVVE
jgi:YVTN family beta-propeller protein